jgi:hypothetical protein
MAVDNPEEAAREPLIARGAGLDVHNETGAVWVRVPGPTGARGQHVRTVGTMTAALLVWRDGRTAQGVRQVARERPGVYGQPIDSVRDEAFTCLWVNAAHRRNVPVRARRHNAGYRKRPRHARGGLLVPTFPAVDRAPARVG